MYSTDSPVDHTQLNIYDSGSHIRLRPRGSYDLEEAGYPVAYEEQNYAHVMDGTYVPHSHS